MNIEPSTLLRQVADTLDRADQRQERSNLWTRDRVADYLSTSTDKLDKYRALPDFPKPLRLGGEARMLRWVPEEIEWWAMSQRATF